jgi:CHAT domain-containing protein
MIKNLSQLTFLILFLSPCLSLWAEEGINQEVLSALLAAKSEEEGSQILESNKNSLTVDLRKALIEEGNKLRVKNDFTRALTLYNLAKLVAEQIGDRAGVGHSLRGIGILHSVGNDLLAMDYYQKSLAIAREVNDKNLEAGCLRSMSWAEYDRNPEAAIGYCKESLRIAEEVKDKLQIATGYYCLGSFNVEQGNYAIALESLEKSLALQEEIGNKELSASILNSIAVLYDRQGNYEQALEHYQKSLKLREEIGDRWNGAIVLSNMGDVRLLKSIDTALEYNKRSLAIAEELGDKRLAARACVNIGNKYRDKGDYDQALNYGVKALEIAKGIQYALSIADSNRLIATAYYLKSDYEKSLEFADQAVTEAKKTGIRQSIWNALQAKGKAHRSLKQNELARKSFEEAIATIEDWRSLVAGGEMGRQSHFSERVSPYHEMIDLLVSEGDSPEAFTYAEGAKARVLLDVTRSGKTSITENMTLEEKEQERKLYKELASLNQEIQDEKMNEKPDQNRLADLEAKIQKVRLNFESFRTKLYAAHPQLKVHRGEANPLKAADAVQLFTDLSTALLEYVVTDERTFLFLLSSEKKIPSVYTIPITQEDLAARVKDFRIKMGARDPGFMPAATALFEMLVGPVGDQIKNKSNLILAPDDVLWSLPFQALQTSKNRFLLEDFAISYVPSLTVLKEIRQLHKDRNLTGSKNLFALGNPMLGNQTIERVKRVYRDEKLDPLPEAEKEVIALKDLYGVDHSKIFIGSDAREDRIKKEAGEFDVLHFATHGIVNDTAPMYSQLILARDSKGEEDGVLEAWEIMNLKLKADLVVLSACDTALGKVQQGEGMIGLAWSLFVAGSPTTVASQWKVDSASTTDLMLEFHKNLKSKTTKAEALRKAALKLFHTDQYHHPFYWAPYVLIGDGY